jgi:hypothetical protein
MKSPTASIICRTTWRLRCNAVTCSDVVTPGGLTHFRRRTRSPAWGATATQTGVMSLRRHVNVLRSCTSGSATSHRGREHFRLHLIGRRAPPLPVRRRSMRGVCPAVGPGPAGRVGSARALVVLLPPPSRRIRGRCVLLCAPWLTPQGSALGRRRRRGYAVPRHAQATRRFRRERTRGVAALRRGRPVRRCGSHCRRTRGSALPRRVTLANELVSAVRNSVKIACAGVLHPRTKVVGKRHFARSAPPWRSGRRAAIPAACDGGGRRIPYKAGPVAKDGAWNIQRENPEAHRARAGGRGHEHAVRVRSSTQGRIAWEGAIERPGCVSVGRHGLWVGSGKRARIVWDRALCREQPGCVPRCCIRRWI